MTRKLKVLSILFVVIIIILAILFFINKLSDKDIKKVEIDERELDVKVLNGCGVPGLARDYENFLKAKFEGYRNPLFKFSEPSNTRKYIYNKSIIIVSQELDLSVSPNNLEVLMDRTGIRNWTYAIDRVELPDYQFLIIVGRDFQNIMK
ncbi:LytR C-terminal domain-containing protein [bacterium]|nr:LytR C-terminal domain-containing protein [bacterium]